MSECRSCRAPVVWALTPKGEKAPIDRAADPEKGNVLLVAPGVQMPREMIAVVLSGTLLEQARAASLPLRTNHFATCPQREEHRRER